MLESATFSRSKMSISLASSAARLAAWAGVLEPAANWSGLSRSMAVRHCSTNCIRVSVRSSAEMAGGRSSPPEPKVESPARPLSKFKSSSPSEIGRMRGISSARAPEAARKASCAARAARRVGSSSVTSGKVSGLGLVPPGFGKWPLSTACASAVRNGLPGGTVKTRGLMAWIVVAGPWCGHPPARPRPRQRPRACRHASKCHQGAGHRAGQRRLRGPKHG